MGNNFLDFNHLTKTLLLGLATIVTASVAGIVGGLTSGAIIGFIGFLVGIILEIFNFTTAWDLMSILLLTVFMVGFPLGTLIGLVTGVHFVVFRLFRISSFFWAIMTCLSVIAGLWFSSLHASYLFQDVILYLGIAIVSFTTGWSAHRAASRIRNENKSSKGLFPVLTGSISGSVIIASGTCYYFTFIERLMEYAQSIPS